MALTKQFVATLSLVLFIFLIVFIRNRQSIIFSVIPFTLNLIFKYLYFESANLVTYTNDLDYKDLILDFLYLRDLEFGNISKIVINFWIDKPLTILIVYYVFIIFLFLIRSLSFSKEELIITSFTLVNILFVFLLYISYWKNIEIQSSYRYILNVFYLIFFFIILKLDEFERIRQS